MTQNEQPWLKRFAAYACRNRTPTMTWPERLVVRKDCGRQLLESERFHAVQELQAPKTDIEQVWFWSEFLDSNIHTDPYVNSVSMLKYVMMTCLRSYKYYVVTWWSATKHLKSHYENRSVSMRESINLLWLKRPCYDLTLRQRFHAETEPLLWLKTAYNDLILPLVGGLVFTIRDP